MNPGINVYNVVSHSASLFWSPRLKIPLNQGSFLIWFLLWSAAQRSST